MEDPICAIKKFNTNKYATAKLIRSNATDVNKKVIKIHNSTAVFKTKTMKMKFEEFLSMDNPILIEITSQCNVSRRDAMVFRKLKKEQMQKPK